MISIIIPSYNCANFIQYAIESVLNQAYTNYEIIVVDDGSTDDTKAVLASIDDDRLIIVEQTNQGASAARNHGLKLAKGEFVAFLDADDQWFSHKLQKQAEVFEKYSDLIAVFSNFHITSVNNDIISTDGIKQDYAIFKDEHKKLEDLFQRKEDNIYKGCIVNSLFMGNFIKTSSFIVKRSALDKTGFFDPDLITQEDYDLWLRLSLLGEFAYIDEPLLNRSKRPGQLTSDSNKLRIAEDVVTVVEKFSKSDRLDLPKNTINTRLRKKYRDLCLNLLGNGDKKKARQVLIKSIIATHLSVSTLGLLLWSIIPDFIAIFIRTKVIPVLRS